MKVVDDEGVVIDGVGEVCGKGPNVMVGYWNNEDATRESLSEDGWFKTGDLGYFDEEGFLYIVDRKKETIVTGGFNVYAREVENVIGMMEAVDEVAVVGLPSDQWGEQVVAFVTLRSGRDLRSADVVAHCREAIAGYKVPKRVEIVGSLPKSSTGKILKRDLRDAFWAGRDRQVV